jgi:uncharacterized RDD family membrane protein YckC
VNEAARAGFARRFGALAYDALLIGAVLTVFTAAALVLTHGQAIIADQVGAWIYVYRAGLIGLIAGYFVLNWMRSGQTLGMRAWQLVIVDEAGGRLQLGPALLRFVCAAAAWLPAGLGVLWMYVDREGLPPQDRLTHTRCVHLRRI